MPVRTNKELPPRAQSEIIVDSLPQIAEDFQKLWRHFANPYMKFAGDGGFGQELGPKWANSVGKVLEGYEESFIGRSEDWGEMVTALHDLSSELKFYFSDDWAKSSGLRHSLTGFRMDRDASTLMRIFIDRGYIQKDSQHFHHETPEHQY